jgi:hypothetical protein
MSRSKLSAAAAGSRLCSSFTFGSQANQEALGIAVRAAPILRR